VKLNFYLLGYSTAKDCSVNSYVERNLVSVI